MHTSTALKEYAGKFFIPSKRNLDKFSRRVEELRLKALNKSQEKLLDSVSATYILGEPHLVPVSYVYQNGFVFVVTDYGTRKTEEP